MLRRLEPATAPDETLNWMYELRLAAHRESAPAEPFESRDRYFARLRHPAPGGLHYTWIIGGVGHAILDIDDETPLGFVRVVVAAPHRRRGAGRELIEAVIHQARSVGCPKLTSQYGTEAGAAFAAELGFRPGLTVIRSVLSLPAALAPMQLPGITVRTWRGPTPDELFESYVLARQAISDAPFEGELDPDAWTGQRIRDLEQVVVDRGVDSFVTVAVEGDRVVATTELRASQQPGADASTEDTSVVRDRRGLGLGQLVKTASLRALAADRPDIPRVSTSNHETNAPMLAINRRLGFVEVSRWRNTYLSLR